MYYGRRWQHPCYHEHQEPGVHCTSLIICIKERQRKYMLYLLLWNGLIQEENTMCDVYVIKISACIYDIISLCSLCLDNSEDLTSVVPMRQTRIPMIVDCWLWCDWQRGLQSLIWITNNYEVSYTPFSYSTTSSRSDGFCILYLHGRVNLR